MTAEHQRHFPIVLKLDCWPTQDRLAWERLFAPRSLFDDGFSGGHWSEGTRRLRQQGYGQWLSFILRSHPDLAELQPSERVVLSRVSEFIAESKDRLKLRSVSNLVGALAAVVTAMAPEQDWEWLWRAGERLYQQSDPLALKPRLPVSAAEIFRWSLSSLGRLDEQTGPDTVAGARQYRQALMVGLLIARPVRARAFSNMRLDRHLRRSSGGFCLHFDRDDMKDKRSRVYPVPNALVAPMETYLSVYRPVLARGREMDALWISEKGRPLSQDSFTRGLALLTKRYFGLVLRPHAFRHIAATSIAELDPAHAGIIRDILGHASLNMAERHYNRASAITASTRMQEILSNIRREHRKRQRTARRPDR